MHRPQYGFKKGPGCHSDSRPVLRRRLGLTSSSLLLYYAIQMAASRVWGFRNIDHSKVDRVPISTAPFIIGRFQDGSYAIHVSPMCGDSPRIWFNSISVAVPG